MASLIIAYSGRALAAAAARAGEPVHVIDWFGDEDTRALTQTCFVVPPGEGGSGFALPALEAALIQLTGQLDRIVYGAGIEGNPALLARLEQTAPVAGNPSSVLALVKDPASLAGLLDRVGATHPQISFDPPGEPGWLQKRIGGSGGSHVSWAARGDRPPPPGHYYQRAVGGIAVSVLFAASGTDAAVLGLSEQWTASTGEMPFRYGGCAGPIDLAETTVAELTALCRRVAATIGLVGLNGLDCLVTPDGGITVIEINPRPGAAIDVFGEAMDLWSIHVDAVAGRLPRLGPSTRNPTRAAAILYADHPLVVPAGFEWPDWIADRPAANSPIADAMPICTVFAEAGHAADARTVLEIRSRSLYKRLIDGDVTLCRSSHDTSHTDPSVAV